MRLIPAVDQLLREEWTEPLIKTYGRTYLKSTLQRILEELRRKAASGEIEEAGVIKKIEKLPALLKSDLKKGSEPYLKRVINCTGVVIHTNLGRSPLPEAVFKRASSLATRFTNLEFNLEDGKRSSRNFILDSAVKDLFPGYETVVVNNNAAAVMLVLNTFAYNKKVVISRGELIEIGGSFRIPDVMEKSGAILNEVGTTNKTRLMDYEKGINDDAALLMSVHPSNYKIIGFTESVKPWELIDLAEKSGIPLYYDMGSGNLIDDKIDFLAEEPTLSYLVDKGVQIISFSGDKMLGGSQAGIILAKPAYIKQLRQNQLLRALRADKVTYLLLEEIFRMYLVGSYKKEIPVYRMLTAKPIDLLARVKGMRKKISNPNITSEIIEGKSFVGGGAAPERGIDSPLLRIRHSAIEPLALQKKLRDNKPPVIARVEDDHLLLDLRAVFEDEETAIVKAVNSL